MTCPTTRQQTASFMHMTSISSPPLTAMTTRFPKLLKRQHTGSRLQSFRGDPDNLLTEGTNATDKASTQGQALPDRPGRRTTSTVFHLREAHLRLPPPFRFFAPETSKPTPDRIATLVVTQSATAPHHCAAPLPTAPPCPTSISPAAASTIQTC